MSGPPSGTVTLLFSDIEGSTRLLQRAGEAYSELLAEHRRLLREAFAHNGGFEMDSEGDAFFVAFESANDAATAAAAAQRALAAHDWPDGNEVRVRMGLHTGEPRAVGGRYVGLVVHAAARIMAAGHGGQVLVSESTCALLDDRFEVRDLGAHRLKDLPGTQQLYQLQIDGLPANFPPLKTLDHRPTNLPLEPNAFIGRTRELKEAWALLTREDARLLTLTGTGGAGKTRLALRLASGAVEEFPNGSFFVSLETVREYACDVLETQGNAHEARRRHAEYFAESAERLDVESRTGDHSAVLARLQDERPNLRAAYEWASERGEGELMLRIAAALWGFWAASGHITEGRLALEEALGKGGERPARALIGLCNLRLLSGDTADLTEDIDEALNAAEELGDDFTLAQAWNLLGRLHGSIRGEFGEAERAWRQALTYAERGGFTAETADIIGWLVMSTIFGPLPVAQGIVRCNQFLENTGDDPTIRAWCCTERSVLGRWVAGSSVP